MAPILYMFFGSPPVRAVMMTAKELGIELELKEVDLYKNEHHQEEYLKLNPAHTVPTLDDNGFILYESSAIMQYLVDTYGKNDSLCPKDIKKRAIVVQVLHFYTTTFDRHIAMFRPILVQGKKKSEVPQEIVDNLLNAFETLEKIIGNKPYLTGENLTIADLGFVTLFTSAKIAFPNEMERLTKLNAWLERLEQRPSYDINRKGLSFLRKFFTSEN